LEGEIADFDQALKLNPRLSEAIKLNSNYAAAYLNRAIARQVLGEK
jgi:hypothetical protein